MKKRILAFLLIFILLAVPFLIAQDDDATNSEDPDTADSQIDKAYDCLETNIEDRGCEDLSPTEKIFALMATGKCQSSVMSDSKSGECWPETNCRLKTTAQAVLALEKVSETTTTAEEWLLKQNDTPSDVDWFLQIETSEASECTIKYSTGGDFDIRIREDKKVSGTAGDCLSSSSGNWWYRISPSCYNVEFEISCDQAFLTNLLFKERSSSTYHVSEKTSSSSAEGTTREKVDSLCLEEDGTCNYEGTLWGAVALNSAGIDITSFMPYLITGAEQNSEILPEALLYILTGYSEFRNTVLQKQQRNQYWDFSANKFQDTALALYPFQYSSSAQKTNSINWLLEIQESDGCWDSGNVLSNSFLLTSIWPRQVVGDIELKDCTDAGFFCMSQANCEGNILEGYTCNSAIKICCDEAQEFELCSEQGGYICNSNEECLGGTSVDASDTSTGETCCVDGRCNPITPESECVSSGGSCRSFGCGSDEEESGLSCELVGDKCCIEKSESDFPWLIIILIILIILVVLGIVFRKKLKPFWDRFRSKFSKKKSFPSNPGNRFPPSSRIPLRSPPRRLFPPSMKPSSPRAPFPKKPQGDLDDVLKKLKEIGK
jgi:hypothetical protein